MLIQPIPITPTFTSTAFTSTAFTSTTFIGSPTALIAIARTSRDGDGYRYWDVVPIELPRLLVFGDGMEVDDDVFHDDHNEAVHDVDVLDAVDVDSSDSDSESTTSTTSRISDISSITSVSSSSSIAKSSPAAAGVVYVPPHKLSTTKSESEFDSGGSIPSHRLLSRSRSQHPQHPRRRVDLGLARVSVDNPKSTSQPKSQSQSKSQSKSSVSVCRYKYQGGETGVMTGGVMLGSTTRSPFTPTPTLASTRPTRASTLTLASTCSRPPLARTTKRGTARTLILGPDSSSSLDWRRPRVPSLLV